MPNPLEDMRRQMEEAREQFRVNIQKVLTEASTDADRIAQAIGEISVDEAYHAWALQVMKKLKV